MPDGIAFSQFPRMHSNFSLLRQALAGISLFTFLVSCGNKKADPDPTPPHDVIYSVRYSGTFSAASTSFPGVDIDAESFQPLGSSMRDFYDFIGNGVYAPIPTPVQRVLSPEVRGKRVRLSVSFFDPLHHYPIKAGDGITAELLGDNTVLANVSITYAEAQGMGITSSAGADYFIKAVEVRLP